MRDGIRFTAKAIENIETRPGCWNHQLIGVFDGDAQVGTYKRNYSCLSDSFFAFELRGKWFALYSPNYTATRVMSLPDCTDLGGELPDGSGFCPVEFYVPEACGFDRRGDDPEPDDNPRRDIDRYVVKKPSPFGTRYVWPEDKGGKSELAAEYKDRCRDFDSRHDAWMKRNPIVTKHIEVGFVAGCHWGDDWSMKIQAIDLSRADEGVISRDERFGYIWLPNGVRLADAIDVESISDFAVDLESAQVKIALPVTFKLSGERVEA